ncbi:MAG: hypothetical protein LIP23_02335 [Planctomycetes bacterium]|nr:hypothetical protein [Planctomycetota bacterium]
MSNIQVTDQRGGQYQAVIEFSYGECERLPFNILRRIGARIETIPDGGINATAEFNIRNPQESAEFLQILDLFGEDGAFIHGSPAEAEALARTSPPAEDAVMYIETSDADDDDLEIEGTLGRND